MKLNILMTIVLFSFSNSTFAKDCQTMLQNDKTLVEWTAFKTPKKVGVGAKFDKFVIKTNKGMNLAKSIKGTTFTIDTQSVNSGNPARDAKIVKFFFQNNGKPVVLSGKFISVKEKEARVALKFNGKARELNLAMIESGDSVVFTGKINVEDFLLSNNLKALTEACKELHEGVTWPDVEFKITTFYEKKGCE